MAKAIYFVFIPLLIVAVVGFSIALFTPHARAATFSLAQAGVTNSEITGTGSYTVAFGSNVTSGNVIFCTVTSDGNVAGEITSLTDTRGDTYTKDFEQTSTLQQVSIWRAPVVGSGANTVTINYNSANSNNSGVACQEWSYGTGTITVDKTKGATATSATPTTGASAATTQANELVVVGNVMDSTNTTCTAGAGYSNVAFKTVASANVCMESAEVSITGAQTGGLTWTTSRNYGIGLVTYYIVSGGGGATGNSGSFVSGRIF